MVWKKGGSRYKHNECIWKRWFCVKPRETSDGYVVWLAWCEREYWYDTSDDTLNARNSFRLTQRMREKLGLTW